MLCDLDDDLDEEDVEDHDHDVDSGVLKGGADNGNGSKSDYAEEGEQPDAAGSDGEEDATPSSNSFTSSTLPSADESSSSDKEYVQEEN